MKTELLKIANTLILYSYHVKNAGLLTGKMGIILYLYRYARFVESENFENFADKLLDEVVKSIPQMSPHEFENGLSGLAWGINYLIKNNFINGNPNEVFCDMDKKVLGKFKCTPSNMIFGQGIYLLERISENKTNLDYDKHIEEALNFLYTGMKEFKGKISLYHLNSVLFFLDKIDGMDENYSSRVDPFLQIVSSIIQRTLKEKSYDNADVFIYNRILLRLENKWKESGVLPIPFILEDLGVECKIKIGWLERLYWQKNTADLFSSNEIIDFVIKKQDEITLDGFLYKKGLTGLGCTLLDNI